MNTLALDIATNTGWAMNVADKISAGSICLADDRMLRVARQSRLDRRQDIRVQKMYRWVKGTIIQNDIQLVVFEDVKFARSQAQAHLWASLRGAVWCACVEADVIRVDCLDTAKLKKFATGNGLADKAEMARALLRQEPQGFSAAPDGLLQKSSGKVLDDDAIDAYHLLKWSLSVYNL